jgi:hypothetical protein
MKRSALVEITKFKAPPGEPFPPADLNCYIHAADNTELAQKAEYTAQGVLREDIVEGRSVRMIRFQHNGERSIGRYGTPPVVTIVGNCFVTAQAIYVVKVLRPPRQTRDET